MLLLVFATRLTVVRFMDKIFPLPFHLNSCTYSKAFSFEAYPLRALIVFIALSCKTAFFLFVFMFMFLR
jgi:hypothetical protein